MSKQEEIIIIDNSKTINLLKQKLNLLQNMKFNSHKQNDLKPITKTIRRLKHEIRELENVQQMKWTNIRFNGGKVIYSKNLRKIQFIFENAPSTEIIDILIHTGFKEENGSNKIWGRFIKRSSIYATKYVLYKIKEIYQN